MIEWGDALIKELAARRCIIFFGSGASADCLSSSGSTKPPVWNTLLDSICDRIKNNEEDKQVARNLIADKRYLDAAEVILESMVRDDYVDALRHMIEVPKFKPSAIHESILGIDPKVVITTNFDTVYDTYCRNGSAHEGYNVFKHTDAHLVSQLRSPIRCVIKAHGCITDPDSMVLTRSEFFLAKQKAPQFFRILDALFLTQTILFVGYSLNDPDIQIVLENANIAAVSSHKHYFVTESGTHPAIKKSLEKAYNILFLEYPCGQHSYLVSSLSNLKSRVEEMRTENPAI